MDRLSEQTLHEVAEWLAEEQIVKLGCTSHRMRQKLFRRPRTTVRYDQFGDGCDIPEQTRHVVVKRLADNVSDLSVLFRCLPKTLNSLHIDTLSGSSAVFDKSAAALLPRTLTCLGLPLCNFELDAIQELPNLTDLVIGSMPRDALDLVVMLMFDSITPVVTAKILPHSIVRLLVPSFSGSDIINLPSTLTSLGVHSTQDIDNEHVMNLPRGLLHLYLGHTPQLSAECVKDLPRGLLSLTIDICRLTDASINDLPKTLTFFNPGEGAQLLTDDCLEYLPKKLVHFDISWNRSFDGSRFQNLPPSLTVLGLGTADAINPKAFCYFPKYLTLLNIGSVASIRDKHIRHLPKYLQTLIIDSAKNLTDAAIVQLPRLLEHLSMTYAVLLTDECIKDLPPNLQTLNIASNKNFTDACAIHLPRQLVYLNFESNVAFTDEVFDHLPISLRRIRVCKNKNITKEAVAGFTKKVNAEVSFGNRYPDFGLINKFVDHPSDHQDLLQQPMHQPQNPATSKSYFSWFVYLVVACIALVIRQFV